MGRSGAISEAHPCSTAPAAVPVVLDWQDLCDGKDLTSEVKEAFGEGGLGLCAVRGVPGLAAARRALLPLALKVGKLSEDVLKKYERPETHYSFGWSHGRESFKGKPDLTKGSWYANPIWDDPACGDQATQAKYPYAASHNEWPSELPELESAFKTMGKLIYDVAQPIVKQCDKLVAASFPTHKADLHEKTFTNSKLVVGRLLHYYPGQGESWCGWHNDNSVITGLVPAMWLNSETEDEVTGVSSDAGLYVQSRSKTVQRVAVPPDCLLFQIGESAQILSGGVLGATPHFVRGHVSRKGEVQVSRETFALFMEPQWDMLIGPPKGASYADVLRDEEVELIPPLSKRLKPDPETKLVEFGKLLGDSIAEYYKHNN